MSKKNKSIADKQEKKSGAKPCGCGRSRVLPRKSAASGADKNTGSAATTSND